MQVAVVWCHFLKPVAMSALMPVHAVHKFFPPQAQEDALKHNGLEKCC